MGKETKDLPNIPKKVGRPTVVTPEIIAEIVKRIRLGETLTAICEEDRMPHRSTILDYKDKDEEFADAYTRARQEQMQSYADRIMNVVDDSSRDLQPYTKYNAKGDIIEQGVRSDNTAALRDRLRFDAMKWLMSKLLPNVFGDTQVAQAASGQSLQVNIVIGNKEQSNSVQIDSKPIAIDSPKDKA